MHGSHSVTFHPTQVNTANTLRLITPPSQLDLPTPEGWKDELTYVTGYMYTKMFYPPTDGNPSK